MDDVGFYDKQVQFQEQLGQIQQQRSKLEKEFHTIVRSDKRLQNLRTTKLRSFWKQICDREQKAMERNEELVRDFENLEAKYNSLHRKTVKLRQMKKQYEEEVTKLYPKWKQEVEYVKAKRQLENRGIDVNTSPSHGASSTTHDQSFLTQFDPKTAPLFKLVPVEGSAVPLKSTEMQAADFEQKATDALSHVSQSSVQSSSQSYNVVFPNNQQRMQHRTEVPPLDLPSSAEREKSPTSSYKQHQGNPLQVAKTLPPTNSSLSEGVSSNVISPVASPEPMSPTHSKPPAVKIHKVEQSSNGKKIEAHQDGNILDLLSEVSTQESDSFSDDDFIPEVSRPEAVGTESSKQPVATNSGMVAPSETSSVISLSHSSPNKIIVPVPGVKEEIHQDVVESILSESLTTETSPRTDAPLTSSAAYQALLKGHDQNLASTLGASGFYEDQDDLEEVLSPKVEEESSEEDESEQDSVVNASPIVHIPTALHHSESNASTQGKPVKQAEVTKKNTRAPWDTDSEEESFDSRHQVAGGGQLDDDDFDFYD